MTKISGWAIIIVLILHWLLKHLKKPFISVFFCELFLFLSLKTKQNHFWLEILIKCDGLMVKMQVLYRIF